MLPRPETKDSWTVKDALVHTIHWKAGVARSIRREPMPAEERGLSETEGNHLIYLRWRDRSPQQVLAWYRQVRQDVLDAPDAWYSARERRPDWPDDLAGHSIYRRVNDIEPALQARSQVHSTVTDFARFRGWPTSSPRSAAMG